MQKRTGSVGVVGAMLLLAWGASAGAADAVPVRTADDALVGAWHAKVQFTSGAFAAVKDLELMYAFNAGGTLTESSNYDAAPPVPPAYGVWRQVQPGLYEARYQFFVTQPPKAFDDLAQGGGWAPGGLGVIVERITLSADGKSYRSTLRVDVFDRAGKLLESGSAAEGRGERIGF